MAADSIRPAFRLSRGLRPMAAMAVVFAAGTGAEGETLSAEEVLDSMATAIASERSRNSIQSFTATAECTGPDGDFETTVTSIRPDAVYFRQASARGITEIWSTAERTWGGNAGEEYESLTPRVRDFVRGHEFHLMVIDMRVRFSDFQMVGPERRSDATECLRISMRDAADGDASVCVRTDNWLPAEMQLNPGSATGPVRIAFGDWRDTTGLKIFHSLEIAEEPDRVFTYDYVDISVNTFAGDMRVPPPDLPRVQGSGRQ